MSTKLFTSKQDGMGWAAVFTTLIFLFILALSPSAIDIQASNIQPELLELAVDQPESTVRVIIQKSSADADVIEVIQQVGGKVVQDLHFIQAVAAELPAYAIMDIAEDASVNWVSLDRALMTAQVDEAVSFYLQTNPFPAKDDTQSQEVLPLSTVPPTAVTLYNYDTNRDDYAGLLLAKGGSGYPESDTTKIQRWQAPTTDGDLHLTGEATLTIFAAMKEFHTEGTAQIQAYLLDWDGNQAQLIAQNSVSNSSWDGSWQPLTINFGLLDYTILAGHQLELALLVDDSSSNDMWLAFGTDTLFSNLTVAQVDLIPTSTQTIGDEFNQISWLNNNGTMDWSGPWTGYDAGGAGASDGYIYIQDGRFTFHYTYANVENFYRSADLTGATQATLTFDWETQGLDSGETISVLVSQDGQQFTELAAYGGSQSGQATFDISDYIAATTTIRVENKSTNWESGEYAYFDNMFIEVVGNFTETTADPPQTDFSGPVQTVRDEFNQVSYENNDGTMNWSGPWDGYDYGGGGASGGYVYVSNGRLTFHYAYAHAENRYRSVDLSGFSQATLSFDWQTQGLDSGETISVYVSQDGQELTELSAYGGTESGSANFDISPYISANTTIRFENRSHHWEYGEYAYFDNIQIEAINNNSEPDSNPTPAPTPTDSPSVEPPAAVDRIVRDEFSNLLYDGNNGTIDWNNNWQELNESDGPGYGLIRVVSDTRCASGYCLRLGAYSDDDDYGFGSRGLSREADLSGATSATLTFDYQRRSSYGSANVTLAVSADGGATWADLATYALNSSDSEVIAQSFDISSYSAANTQIRFIGTGSIPEEVSTYIYIDNIQIDANGTASEPAPTLTPTTPVPTAPSPTPVPTDPAPTDPADPGETNPATYNHFLNTTNVQPVWDMGYQGQGVAVAVIDSGISASADFGSRLIAQHSFNSNADSPYDNYGHGTHIAGIIAGDGTSSNGLYKGIAPQANLISLKVSDDSGMAYESDTVAALQWVFENKDTYNIRVVNLSLNSISEESYHTSALDLASEMLWFNGVVVVASSGNRSLDGNFYTITASPANDPYIIAVGASTEAGTDSIEDDDVALFSAHGTTVDGFVKPDIIAPGYNIVSVLSADSDLNIEYPERLEGNDDYFRLSGTSMAAPMVSGAAALILQADPTLTPDQVKYRLMNSGNTITPLWFDAILDQTVYPYLDVHAAVTSTSTESANQDVMPHIALAQMALIAYWANQNGAETIDWANVDWSAVNWDNVDWDNVDWASVNWGSVNWGSVNWGSVNWGSVNWGSVNWGSVNWGSVNWGSVNWGSVNWGSVNWGSVSWDD
jgi:serine protease AprX